MDLGIVVFREQLHRGCEHDLTEERNVRAQNAGLNADDPPGAAILLIDVFGRGV
jgi:hypothetical protein